MSRSIGDDPRVTSLDATAAEPGVDLTRAFAAVTAGLGDAFFLVAPDDGRVLARNGPGRRLLASSPDAADLNALTGSDLRDFLRGAARRTDPSLMTVTLGAADVRWRLEAWRAGGQGPPHVVVRLYEHRDAIAPFASLNTKLAELSREIRRRRRAEQRLTETVDELSAVFGRAPAGIAVVTRSAERLTITRANASLGALCGMDEETLRSVRLHELIAATHHGELDAAIERVVDGLVDQATVRVELRRADGAHIPVAVSMSRLGRQDPEVDPQLIVHVVDHTERQRYEARLRYLADHDPITGLYNRRRFEEELERVVSEVRRYGDESSLLLIDLDGFKGINDTLGHAVGDEMIRHAAGVLVGRLRETDIVARLGGDEFAVVLPHTGLQVAEQVAEELRQGLRSETLATVEGGRVSTTAAIGVAGIDRNPQLTAQGVLVKADVAMYEAKDGGGDRVALMRSGVPAESRIQQEHHWTQRLHDAIDRDRLLLHAQPILDLATGQVHRHELLVRMDDGEGGVVMPSAFLPVAERVGMIRDVDRWVVTRALDVLLALQAAGREDTLEVNLSGASVTDPDVMTFIVDHIAATGVDASRLVFEITETAAIGNVEVARTFAHRLSELGCGFALDDFGAGFGSFYYLKHLPAECLKIDGDFVRELTSNTADQLTVRAIVEIARGLGKHTIAEFVGDEATIELLRDLGVDFAQGFHIGVPRAVEELLGV